MKTIAFLFTFCIMVAAQHAGAENASPLPSDGSFQPDVSFENYEKRLLKEKPIEPLDGEERRAVAAKADGLEAKDLEVQQAFESREELALRVLTASEELEMRVEALAANVPSEMKIKPAFEAPSLDQTDIDGGGIVDRKEEKILRGGLLERDQRIDDINLDGQLDHQDLDRLGDQDSGRKELFDSNRSSSGESGVFLQEMRGKGNIDFDKRKEIFREGHKKKRTLRIKIPEDIFPPDKGDGDDSPAPGFLPVSSSQPVVIAIAALNRQLLDFLQKSAFSNRPPKTEEAAAEETPLPRRENDPAVNSQDRAMEPPAPPEERDRNVPSRDTLARLGLRANVSAPTQPESQEINADAAGQRASREVLDSVNVGPELAALHLLLHPPKKLNPYLRWLLYTRAMRDENIRAYVEVREKMREIYKRAQAGEGDIRYRNKTGITIEPLATDMGGSYALVARRNRTADTDNVQS